jgi:hypothetical protein
MLAVLLQLTAILRRLLLSLGIPLIYIDAARTRTTETLHVIAVQSVHCRCDWIYGKHMSRDRYLLLCDVTADTKNTASPIVSCVY